MSSKKNKLLENAQKNIQKGQFSRAITEYEEIIRLDPADVRHRQRLAELLTKADRKDDAVKEYHSLAKNYVDNVNYLKAIAVYKQIQKLEPANAETSLTLASLNEKQGLAGNAAAEYSLAIQIYEKNGENFKALSVLESMLALDPQNLAIRLRIAEKYFSTGSEDKAFGEFLSLAQTLKELNNESGLNHVIERATALFPLREASILAAIADNEETVEEIPLPVIPPIPPTPTESSQKPAESAQQPVEPVQTLTESKHEPAELAAIEEIELSDEPFIAELSEDDLIEEILPIEEPGDTLEMDVDVEIPTGDFDWEEEINISELEFGEAEPTAPADEPEEALELSGEEIHELEDIDLELDIEPEICELADEEAHDVGKDQADNSVDLAGELSLFADEIDFDVMKADRIDGPFSMDTFSAFKKDDLDREDSESHYSLGLAYKEMGLFEDAIAEFEVASRSHERRIDCRILQALCQRDRGECSAATELLLGSLQEPDMSEDQILSIKYELALCHELCGEELKAKQLYTEIIVLRPDFSDSAARLAGIRV